MRTLKTRASMFFPTVPASVLAERGTPFYLFRGRLVNTRYGDQRVVFDIGYTPEQAEATLFLGVTSVRIDLLAEVNSDPGNPIGPVVLKEAVMANTGRTVYVFDMADEDDDDEA